MKVSVLVPTYRRPDDLSRCLSALMRQWRLPDQVVVVTRADDVPTHACLDSHPARRALPVEVVVVDERGLVAALNRGIEVVTGDIVAITDDDAAPHADWVERIEAAFSSDPRLGALGGRDWVHERGQVLDGERELVGKVLLSGRIVGNHHLGVGEAREVDLLKGVNMSYRCEAVRHLNFDRRLRGTGAQVHNDMGFSMGVKHAGWKVVYDPAIAVDHYPAPRFGEEPRDALTLASISNAAYNLHLILSEHLPLLRRTTVWWWYTLIGTRLYPGLAHVGFAMLSNPRTAGDTLARWRAVRSGAVEARRSASRRPVAAKLTERAE
ncbi:glycosyl transferase [Burkholderia sp. WAC0059]|uniref:glycosyltransferase family 2 protein n=1 Tax=Burkholderia sp. WAC0059 TaxID=2066022 RepID=UPI000C7F21EF|nr:glycosyltransferase family 2 protein [Burkholderia sp. WAC0059]PLZ04258.1 glycosyl transferase [Burkholderia sp. WAC0059]